VLAALGSRVHLVLRDSLAHAGLLRPFDAMVREEVAVGLREAGVTIHESWDIAGVREATGGEGGAGGLRGTGSERKQGTLRRRFDPVPIPFTIARCHVVAQSPSCGDPPKRRRVAQRMQAQRRRSGPWSTSCLPSAAIP